MQSERGVMAVQVGVSNYCTIINQPLIMNQRPKSIRIEVTTRTMMEKINGNKKCSSDNE